MKRYKFTLEGGLKDQNPFITYEIRLDNSNSRKYVMCDLVEFYSWDYYDIRH